jgi:hypothetical protein
MHQFFPTAWSRARLEAVMKHQLLPQSALLFFNNNLRMVDMVVNTLHPKLGERIVR